MTKELYFSVDVETDGPTPGDNSMLSLGAVAFTEQGQELDSFSANLIQLPEALSDNDTMEWWKKHWGAWCIHRENLQRPEQAMWQFVDWVEGVATKHKGKPVFVGYPAGFDFTFIYWYCHHFTGRCPFGFQGLDMKSFAMALLGTTFKGTVKGTMPAEWFPKSRHTHVAVEDAREQGELFTAMLNASRHRG